MDPDSVLVEQKNTMCNSVLERVIFNQMIKYLAENKLLHPNHHAYRADHNTLLLYKCMMFGYNLWRLESLQGFVFWI